MYLISRIRPRVHTLLSMPEPVLKLYAQLPKHPTLEGLQAAIAEIQRTTGKALREALETDRVIEARYWRTIEEELYGILRFWRKPQSRRGRPKGSKDRHQKAAPKRIDPDMARRAYDLHRDGLKPRQIARRLYPQMSMYECSTNAMRMRISRLIDRGQTLAYEATTKNLHDSK
jgi:hypothetical protein